MLSLSSEFPPHARLTSHRSFRPGQFAIATLVPDPYTCHSSDTLLLSAGGLGRAREAQMRDSDGAMDGAHGMTEWTAEIAVLEGRLAMARARLHARLVARELQGEDPSLIDQATTELGRNNHIKIVRQRMAEQARTGRPMGATKRQRRYLLTQEAHAEELGLTRRPGIAKADAPPPPDDAESRMMDKLARLRGRR